MTDADRVADRYRVIEQQRGGTKFGAFGSQPPSFSTIPAAPDKRIIVPPMPPDKPVPDKPAPVKPAQ
jgi:hypothetical protein